MIRRSFLGRLLGMVGLGAVAPKGEAAGLPDRLCGDLVVGPWDGNARWEYVYSATDDMNFSPSWGMDRKDVVFGFWSFGLMPNGKSRMPLFKCVILDLSLGTHPFCVRNLMRYQYGSVDIVTSAWDEYFPARFASAKDAAEWVAKMPLGEDVIAKVWEASNAAMRRQAASRVIA